MLDADAKILILIVLAPLALTIGEKYLLGAWHARKEWLDREQLPFELQNASLFISEADLSCKNPVPLHGRVDQVFQLENNKLLLTDTKSRDSHQVYKSDIIQLSAYRPMLEETHQSLKVLPYGYIRTVLRDPNGRRPVKYHRVKLLNNRKLTDLYMDYWYKRTGVRRKKCQCNGKFH